MNKKSLCERKGFTGNDCKGDMAANTKSVTSANSNSTTTADVSGFNVVCDGKQTYVNGELLNRMNDTYSKFVFANELFKETTLSLINGFFELEGKKRLLDFEFKDRELDPDTLGGKGVLLDVCGKSSDGTLVNVEIQLSNLKSMNRRTLYYWALLYGRRLQKGENYKNLNRTVVISILSYNLFDQKSWSDYHSCFAVLNTKDLSHRLTDDLEIHFVELPKWHKGDISKLNSLERWLAYLSPDTTDEERRQMAMEDTAIGTAMEAEKLFLSKSDYLTAYERQQKALRDMQAMKEAAIEEGHAEGWEKGHAEGRAEGHAEGRAEGHAEGRAEGLAEGRAEGLAEGRAEGLAEGRAEGLAEGRAEGLAEGKAKVIKKVVLALHHKNTPKDEIATLLDISLAEVEAYIEQEEQ